MKCRPCRNNECEGSNDYHYLCDKWVNGEKCSCYCSETKSEVALKTALSMEVGALAIIGM